MSAGCAVELLAKAHLAAIEPSLLSARADVDGLLHLSGKGTLATSRATEIRTLSATLAVQTAKRLSPEIQYNAKLDDVVFRVRNAAAHMGLVDSAELRRAIGSMVRVVDSLVAASKWTDRRDFWSDDLIPAADAAAMEARHDASARLAAKLAGATIRLRELLSSLSPAAQATVRRSLAGRSPGASIDHDERAKCPVCGEQGWLVCAVEEDHREVDTGEGIFSQIVKRTAWPAIFNCNVCDLDLDEDELREVPGFPYSVDLDLDGEDWEPDEDYIRGR